MAITREVNGGVIDVSAPMDCLVGFGLSTAQTTRYLLVYGALVSVGGRVFIDLGGSSLFVS
ncbi:hypothetical protein [Vulcanisaeta distributa]|uniref:hypothetical protein n=1 Tax=Vulcanisaeta distributa TaxID=164451 RepID=UPI0006D1571D|nr:hypothetical protein [Vulcanisaeta distributa]